MSVAVVGVTGTQIGASPDQLVRLENRLCELFEEGARTLRHGCCVGVDGQAHRIARRLGYYIIGHPSTIYAKGDKEAMADCDELGPYRPPLERNRAIVMKIEYLIVVPKERTEQLRSGTWATYRYALAANVPGVIIAPRGS